MTNKHALLSACALAIVLAISPTVADAQDYENGGTVNYALGAVVTEGHLPAEIQSDTLAAVNDGVQYPEVPHNSGGPNPYAWTNFNSVQTQYMQGGGFTLDFGQTITIDRVVVNYFVDSYSADLPQEVGFRWDTPDGTVWAPFEQVYQQQVAPTCYQTVYRFTGEPQERTTDTLSFFAVEQWGPGDKVVGRCVGVYEIEVYGGEDYWSIAHDYDEPVYYEEESVLVRRGVVHSFFDAEGNRVSVKDDPNHFYNLTIKRSVGVNAWGARTPGEWTLEDGTPIGEGYLFDRIDLDPVPAGYERDIDFVPETLVTPADLESALQNTALNLVQEVNYYATAAAEPEPFALERIGGSAELAAVQVSQMKASSADTVVIVNANAWRDAMSAMALAGKESAPLLYTAHGALAAETIAEIERLGATKAIIVGGTGVVSANVANTLKGMGLSVDRLWGNTAQDTSRAAAAAVGASELVIITTSDYYGDGLSVAPWAYAKHAPIILAEGDGTLSWDSIQLIRDLGAREALVVSGNNALSNSVSNSLVKAAGLDAVTRLNGANSVALSAEVVKWELERGFTLDRIGIVGRNAESAGFVGATLMGSLGNPTIFVNGGNVSSAESVLSGQADAVSSGWIFGDAIPENARTKIEAIF